MPHWIIILLLVIGVWLAASVGGGLLFGRLLAWAGRHTPARRPAA